MLIHAMIHNSTEVHLELWPFTIKYAAYFWNKMSKEDGGMSPEEVFYSVVSDHQSLRDAKVFGCPAYVLEPKLRRKENTKMESPFEIRPIFRPVRNTC